MNCACKDSIIFLFESLLDHRKKTTGLVSVFFNIFNLNQIHWQRLVENKQSLYYVVENDERLNDDDCI